MAANAFLSGFQKDQSGDGKTGGASNAFQQGFQKSQRMQQAKSTLKRAKKSNTSGLKTMMPQVTSMIPSAKTGGRVTKGGLLRVHRGEDIVPAKRGRRKTTSGKQRTITKP